jgi:hypothetical protein
MARTPQGYDYFRKWKLKSRFNMDLEDYEDLLEKQDYRCAICQRTQEENTQERALSVDHCHETGRIRGLLCQPCNLALGHFVNKEMNVVLYLAGSDVRADGRPIESVADLQLIAALAQQDEEAE